MTMTMKSATVVRPAVASSSCILRARRRRCLSSTSSSPAPPPIPPSARSDSDLAAAPSPPPPAPSPSSSASSSAHDADADAGTSPASWTDRLLRLAALWDEASGTRDVLRLKEAVDASSSTFDALRRRTSAARTELDRALRRHEDAQRRHAELLRLRDARDGWTPDQAEEFARLLGDEVRTRRASSDARTSLAELEGRRDRAMDAYMDATRRRYQEEQLWQDRWRVYGTYGTWGLIGLNSAAFFASQYFHWRREARRSAEMRELLLDALAKRDGAMEGGREGVEKSAGAVEDDAAAAEKSTNEDRKPLAAGNNEQANENGADSGSPPSRWARMRQCASDASKKLVAMESLDVPSAVLGASAVGAAWVVTAMLFQRDVGR